VEEKVMSTKLFKRPVRRVPPEMPSGELTLQEPPVLPEEPSGNIALGSSLTMLLFIGGSISGPRLYLVSGLMVMTTLSMLFGMMGRSSGNRRSRTRGERRDYLRYLTQTRRKVREQTRQQQQALSWTHPDPHGLWSVAMSARLWERRPAHRDFSEVRVGTGEQMFAVKITPLQTKPVEDLEPLSARALRRFIRAHATVPDLPIAVFLGGFARILLHGSPEQARALTRALLAQVFTFHSPDDVRIAVCA
jgi:S-DNA-T family DNA segregation ATPase FtsK/SpoIIIE